MAFWGRVKSFLSGNKGVPEQALSYRPGLSPLDMLNFGLVQPSMFQAFILHENCSLLCDIDLTLTQETFRNGIELDAKFVRKCQRCGHESEEEVDKCPSCASTLMRPPMWAQQRYFEHLDGTSFFDRANDNGQTLQDVMESASHYLHVADNAYLLALMTYIFDDQGEVKESYVDELLSLDPRWVEKIFDEKGRPGGRYRLCLAHRTELLGPKEYRCSHPECRKPTHDVTFRVYTANNNFAYYVDEEICHLTEFYPHYLYGTPPSFKIRNEVEAYMYITGRIANYYKKGRAPGVIAVRTDNPKLIDENIVKVNLQLEKEPHSAPFFPVPTSPNGGTGEFMKWIPFMQDPCGEMIKVKDEMRRVVCAFYGIPPMVESDTQASGGLNDEGHQITLLNRRTKKDQAPFNTKAFPWLFRRFGITDLKLALNEVEQNDRKLELEIQILEDQHASNLKNMGFDIWIEDGEYKSNDLPRQQPAMGMMPGAMPGDNTGMDGMDAEGAPQAPIDGPQESVDTLLAKYPELTPDENGKVSIGGD